MQKNILIGVLLVIIVSLFGYVVIKNDSKPMTIQPVMENQQQTSMAVSEISQSAALVKDWKSFTNSDFSIKYPGDWSINEYAPAPGMPAVLFTANSKAVNTTDRTASCVQVSGGYNGPVRTDLVGVPQALINLANSKLDETFANINVVSITPIQVNGRQAIERKITGGNETVPTYETFVLGEISHANDKFPGTLS